jgi:hypothetical protein
VQEEEEAEAEEALLRFAQLAIVRNQQTQTPFLSAQNEIATL